MRPLPTFQTQEARENIDSSIRIEPMTVGMILDATIRIFSRHAWTLWGILAVAWIAQFAILILMKVWEALGDAWSLPLILLMVLSYGVWIVVLLPFATGAEIDYISRIYLGEPLDARLAFRSAWSRIGGLVAANLAVLMLVMVGTLFLIVPGVFLWLTFSVTTPVLLLEKQTVSDAMERSWALTKDNRVRIFAATAITLFFQLVVQLGVVGVMAIFGLGLQSLPTQTLQQICGLALAPLLSIVVVLLYYDLRIRKEGFDLELMSRKLGESPAGPVSVGGN